MSKQSNTAVGLAQHFEKLCSGWVGAYSQSQKDEIARLIDEAHNDPDADWAIPESDPSEEVGLTLVRNSEGRVFIRSPGGYR